MLPFSGRPRLAEIEPGLAETQTPPFAVSLFLRGEPTGLHEPLSEVWG